MTESTQDIASQLVQGLVEIGLSMGIDPETVNNTVTQAAKDVFGEDNVKSQDIRNEDGKIIASIMEITSESTSDEDEDGELYVPTPARWTEAEVSAVHRLRKKIWNTFRSERKPPFSNGHAQSIYEIVSAIQFEHLACNVTDVLDAGDDYEEALNEMVTESNKAFDRYLVDLVEAKRIEYFATALNASKEGWHEKTQKIGTE